jgi:hypothetical protein
MATGRAPCGKSLTVDEFVAAKASNVHKSHLSSTSRLQQIHQESLRSDKIP